MKLSSVLLGTMLVASASGIAQQKNPVKKVENDSLKKVKRLVISEEVKVKKKLETKSIKVEPVDTLLGNPSHINHDYCPPCGRG